MEVLRLAHLMEEGLLCALREVDAGGGSVGLHARGSVDRVPEEAVARLGAAQD